MPVTIDIEGRQFLPFLAFKMLVRVYPEAVVVDINGIPSIQ